MRPSPLAIRMMGRSHVAIYRATRGLIGGRVARSPVLLLTTRGRKSGKQVTVPLLFLKDGNSFIVIASFGGSPKHPAWHLNLRNNPECRVQIKGSKSLMTADTVDPETRDILWGRVVAMYAGYAGYQERTERRIPLVRLTALIQ